MINEIELLTWLDSHKKLALTYVPGDRGKFHYEIDFVALMGKIREMTGISEGGDTVDAKTAEKGQ